MRELPFEIGETFTTAKTVSESDVYLFAGITGDFSPNHVNEEYMSKGRYGHRIAHGMLTLAMTCTASSIAAKNTTMPCVSYGYEHIRFLKAVLFGDTLTTTYTIAEKDLDKMMTISDVKVTNQRGELVLVARHLQKYFEETNE